MSTAFDELRSRIEGLFALASRGGDYITKTQFNAILEIAFPPKLPVEEYTGQEVFPAILPTDTVSVTEQFYAASNQEAAPDPVPTPIKFTKVSDPTPAPSVLATVANVQVQVYRCGNGFEPSGWFTINMLVDPEQEEKVKTLKFSQAYDNKNGKWKPMQLAESEADKFNSYSIGYVLYGPDYYCARRKDRLALGDIHDYTSKNFNVKGYVK